MEDTLINQVVRRRAFHSFSGVKASSNITSKDIQDILAFVDNLTPLDPSIKVHYRIVQNGTNCNKSQEGCILFYSEKKGNYLQNIGYLGMQLDLYLVSKGIGTLWCGMAKPEKLDVEGLDYVIMLAIRKVDKTEFRRNPIEFDRRSEDDIWNGEKFKDFAEVARLAPSACNSQPWNVVEEGDTFSIIRTSKEAGIMPKDVAIRFNRIDMGIFICLVDMAIINFGYESERDIYLDNEPNVEKALVAKYYIKKKLN